MPKVNIPKIEVPKIQSPEVNLPGLRVTVGDLGTFTVTNRF